MQRPLSADKHFVTWSNDVQDRQRLLGRALYPEAVAAKIRSFLSDDVGLRVRIHASDALTQSLPWECARLPGAENQPPLALNSRACVVRSHTASQRTARSDPMAVVAYAVDACQGCSPKRCRTSNGVEPCWQQISEVQTEAAQVAESLRRLAGLDDVRCVPAERLTLERECADNPTVFVFIGHGGFPGRASGGAVDEACLILEGPDGPDRLGAQDLASLVGGCELVALSACFSGYEQEGYPGLRSALTRAGVPVVVGMNGPIEGVQAGVFFSAFFDFLADGWTLAQAMTASRSQLQQLASIPHWGQPVMSVADAPLSLFEATGSERPVDVLTMGEITAGPLAAHWTWADLPDGGDRAACRTSVGLDLRGDPTVAQGGPEVAVSSDGLVMATILERHLEVAWVNGIDGSARRWPRLALESANQSTRVLAVTSRADLGVLVVAADDDATWLITADPKRAVARIVAEARVERAVFVRGRPWLLRDGHIADTGAAEWVPPSAVIDIDVAGPLGGEFVAVLHEQGGTRVIDVIQDPCADPKAVGRWAAPEDASRIRLVRDLADQQPSSLLVEHRAQRYTFAPATASA
ncbi:MAG: CHAT domain-containing protein, partial [Vicinamibacterales bacterium]